MKTFKTGLLLFLLVSVSPAINAARYWISPTASNWNSSANWSNVSGGAGGFSVPGATDDVIFDNAGTGSCTMDVAAIIKSITVTALYSGNINQGANSISVANAATFAGGIFTGGTAGITITGVFTVSGTIFTSTTAILELRTNAVFSIGSFLHNNGTVRFNGIGSVTVSGVSPVFYNLEFVGNANTYNLTSSGNITVINSLNTSGALFYNIAAGTIDVKGDISSTNTATGCGGDALVNINGSGVQNFNGSTTAGAGALAQLTINKSSGSLNLANYPAVSNNFTYSGGTVNAGTSTFSFTHGNTGSYSITGTLSLANIAFNINTSLLTVNIAGTITATGDLTIAGAGNLVMNTGNINVNGNILLTNTGNGGGGSATINIMGTGTQTMDGTAITVNQSRLPVLNINKTSGTLFLLGNISFSANVTYTGGTINPGVSDCYIVNNLTMTGSFSVYNLAVLPAGNTTVTIASGSTVTATNILDLENGSNYININTGTLAVQGNLIDNNTSTAGGGTATILINGPGAQAISATGVLDQGRLPGITINKPSGTLTLPSLITVRGDWTYLAGTLDVATNNSTVVFENTLAITGSHTLNNVTFFGSSNFSFTTAAATTLTVAGTMNMIGNANIVLNSGNINLNGNLILSNTSIGDGGTTAISFVSGVNQSIISSLPINQNALPAININKPGGVLTFPALITVKGNWTYTSGVYDVITNNSTIVFASPLGTGIFGITGSHTLNNVVFEGNNNNTASVNTGTILTVAGTLSTIGTANVFINTPVTGTTAIIAQGDILLNNTSIAGGGTGLILINGTTGQSFTSTIAAGQGPLPYIRIQKTSGTLTMSGVFTETRDWTYVSGVVDATSNGSTVVFSSTNLIITSAGMNFYHLTVNSSTATLANNLSVYGNLTISGTGVLSAAANTIDLKGNWINRGTVGFTEGSSTVNFSGSTVQTLTSPGGDNFTNLNINNSGSGIQLINNITAATTLAMTQGNIDLNGNTLTLGLSAAAKGTLAHSSGIMFNTGSFTRWFNTAAIADGAVAGLFPVGSAFDYRPIYVSAPVTGPVTGGTITVTYANAATNTLVSFIDGIYTVAARKDLNWSLSTAGGITGGNYNLRVEGTGFGAVANVNDLRLTLAAGILGMAGINAGTLTNPQVNRTGLLLTGLSNSFYIGSINSLNFLLPVKLVSFTAVAQHDKVALNWVTAAELNNDHFTIQRSAGGVQWDNVRVIRSNGNTQLSSAYATADNNPLPGRSYYRLMQTDVDGAVSYSAIRIIDFDKLAGISVYPNPAASYIIVSSAAGPIPPISLFNNSGQKISVPVINNTNSSTLLLSGLPAGIYFIQTTIAGKIESKKISVL